MAQDSETALLEGIERSYSSEKYTDVEIICEGRSWKVHKLVICAQSEFFRKLCDGEWKEGKENKIELPDDDPQAVDAMLACMYGHDYGDEGNSQTDSEPMVLDARVFTIADKYFVKSLKAAAAEKFRLRAKKKWKTTGFAHAIAEVYNAGPADDSTLRTIILDVVSKNAASLFGSEEDHQAFHATVDSIGEFAADVTRALARNSLGRMAEEGKGTTYKCPTCSTIFNVQLDANHSVIHSLTCPYGCSQNPQSWWNGHVLKRTA